MILLDLGAASPKKIEELLETTDINFAIITQSSNVKNYFQDKQIGFITYQGIFDDFKAKHSIKTNSTKTQSDNALKIYKKIISDPNTFNIFDRRFWPRSNLRHSHLIIQLIDCYVDFIFKNSIQDYVILSAPHGIHQWVLGHCIEIIRDTQVKFFNIALTPWRVAMVSGMNKKELVRVNPKNKQDLDMKLWDDFCKFKSDKDIDSTPSYERQYSGKNFLQQWLSLVKRNYKRPDKLLNAFRMRLLYNICCDRNLPKKYFVLFLHYQPERTTAPDGSFFANQLLVIRMLMEILPENTELLVREHPSTFNRGSDTKHRWGNFYQDIRLLGAKLITFQIDTYALIDSSDLVISVGGTVVGEALMRNKPSLYFGLGPMYPLDCKSIHYFKNLSELKKFVQNIETLTIIDFKNARSLYKNLLDLYTVSAKLSDDQTFQDLTTLEHRIPAIIECLKVHIGDSIENKT